MKRFWAFILTHRRAVILYGVSTVAAGALLAYKLASLPPHFSLTELKTATTPIGWHGLYQQPFYLPLQLIRSILFVVFSDPGRLIVRIPSMLFGLMTIVAYTITIRLWHGKRTALWASLLFATAAWTLHVSRLASFDIMYLWAMTVLVLTNVGLQRYAEKPAVLYASVLTWGILIYIPGMVWLILASIVLQRAALLDGWASLQSWLQRCGLVLSALVWLPLLVVHLLRPGALRLWLGLPSHFASLSALAKQSLGVYVHLFIRGPQYPDRWLGKAPLLDIFTLVCCLLGIYFYIRHWRASRSKMLISFFLIGGVLVGLGGLVSISLLVPLLYIVAAAGLAYLVHEWLRVFPINPIARTIGISLVSLAVLVSCAYNIRAYFIAWQHSPDTKATFRYHR